MASTQDRYDDVLLGILSTEQKIVGFLDIMFNFLYRRTDFFRTLKEPNGAMGFPPNVAKNIVLQSFKKYETIAKRDEEMMEKRLQAQKTKAKSVRKTVDKPATKAPENVAQKPEVVDMEESCPVVREEVVTTSAAPEGGASKGDAMGDTPSSKEKSPVAATASKPASGNDSKPSEAPAPSTSQPITGQPGDTPSHQPIAGQPGDAPSSSSQSGDSASAGGKTEEEDEDPELTKQQKVFQSQPDSYNGAEREGYSWSQSITDVDIRIKVPPEIVKGRQVRVNVTRQRLTSSVLEGNEWRPLVEGDLCWEVRPDETVWSLVPKEHIHVSLEKVQERWWDAAFTSEEKISVRKIDASRPMTDLDNEAQAKIEELMWNEDRKRKGLPTSDQIKNYDILRRAWDAPGSPFAGQPFDPSVLNMANNGSGFMPPTPPPGT